MKEQIAISYDATVMLNDGTNTIQSQISSSLTYVSSYATITEYMKDYDRIKSKVKSECIAFFSEKHNIVDASAITLRFDTYETIKTKELND